MVILSLAHISGIILLTGDIIVGSPGGHSNLLSLCHIKKFKKFSAFQISDRLYGKVCLCKALFGYNGDGCIEASRRSDYAVFEEAVSRYL